MEGSWRAFSHQTFHWASDVSDCQTIADPPPEDGILAEAVKGSQALDGDTTDAAQTRGPSSTSLEPSNMPESLEDWGLVHTGWVDEPSTDTGADDGASMSLEQLSTALERLTTASSAPTKVLMHGIYAIISAHQPCMSKQAGCFAPHS